MKHNIIIQNICLFLFDWSISIKKFNRCVQIPSSNNWFIFPCVSVNYLLIYHLVILQVHTYLWLLSVDLFFSFACFMACTLKSILYVIKTIILINITFLSLTFPDKIESQIWVWLDGYVYCRKAITRFCIFLFKPV